MREREREEGRDRKEGVREKDQEAMTSGCKTARCYSIQYCHKHKCTLAPCYPRKL